jgi:hypothetical protein
MFPKSTQQLKLLVSKVPGIAQNLNAPVAIQREFLPSVGDNDQERLLTLGSQPVLQPIKASLNGFHGCISSGQE